MKNKKFITLLLAAIVAITSAAPGIQVKAEELFSFNVVLDGSENYTRPFQVLCKLKKLT